MRRVFYSYRCPGCHTPVRCSSSGSHRCACGTWAFCRCTECGAVATHLLPPVLCGGHGGEQVCQGVCDKHKDQHTELAGAITRHQQSVSKSQKPEPTARKERVIRKGEFPGQHVD